jgi:cytochrome c biogenesis protein CcdA
MAQRTGNTLSIIAIVFGAIAIVLFPIVFGVVGIILAAVAKSKGEPLSNWALVVSIAGTVLGFVLAFAVLNSMG